MCRCWEVRRRVWPGCRGAGNRFRRSTRLPEGEEDDGLDEHEFHERVEGRQQVVRAQVEHEKGKQRHAVRDVVDDRDVQVPAHERAIGCGSGSVAAAGQWP